jgi:sulfate adenylyltransferase
VFARLSWRRVVTSQTRNQMHRAHVELRAASGGQANLLVHVGVPLEVRQQRDRKGLYASARAGLVPNFAGVSDPYEPPADAEVVLRMDQLSEKEAAHAVMLHLEREGWVGAART